MPCSFIFVYSVWVPGGLLFPGLSLHVGSWFFCLFICVSHWFYIILFILSLAFICKLLSLVQILSHSLTIIDSIACWEYDPQVIIFRLNSLSSLLHWLVLISLTVYLSTQVQKLECVLEIAFFLWSIRTADFDPSALFFFFFFSIFLAY